ncbi:MAG: hypothetical protein U0904_12000 [Candidatus Nanopelagicales bacterium]|nr:hypothetical protein [Candidatus Nanopelagicales bacterium]
MSVDVKGRPTHRALDRLPPEVPHHRPQMALAWFASAAAVFLMIVWFWVVVSGPGLIPRSDPSADSAASGSGEQQTEKSGVPKAPKSSDTVTEEVEMTAWSVLSADGELRVRGTLENVSSKPLDGTVVAYVFVGKKLVATTKTGIKKFGPGKSKKVTLSGDDEWVPGKKLVVLRFEPAKS